VNTLFQAEAPSIRKRVAAVIVAAAIFGLALWAGIEMASRLISGRS
jgi:hypothetical protein